MMLAEFLLARIDEDEAYAATMKTVGMEAADSAEAPAVAADMLEAGAFILRDERAQAVLRPFLRGVLPPADLVRLAAEAAAKRRIVDLHHEYLGVCTHCFQAAHDHHDRELWPCQTLRLLAQPYADHRDYDPDWRPDA